MLNAFCFAQLYAARRDRPDEGKANRSSLGVAEAGLGAAANPDSLCVKARWRICRMLCSACAGKAGVTEKRHEQEEEHDAASARKELSGGSITSRQLIGSPWSAGAEKC